MKAILLVLILNVAYPTVKPPAITGVFTNEKVTCLRYEGRKGLICRWNV